MCYFYVSVKKSQVQAGDVAQLVKCLPTMYKAPGSVSRTLPPPAMVTGGWGPHILEAEAGISDA